MSSRSIILSKIKASKPSLIRLPQIKDEVFSEEIDVFKAFEKTVETVGGEIFFAGSNMDVLTQVEGLFPQAKVKYSVLPDSEDFNTMDLGKIQKPHQLENLDVLILKGEFGVAENGAIWISDMEIPIRVFPFITKNLILVLDKTKIVSDMHQAYKLISDFDYGLFISGPSKTADIEQSLVIGAQGALSLSVFLM